MSKTLVKIENWSVVEDLNSENYRGLQPGSHLMGYVFGHVNLPNAKFIYTSPIMRVDADEGLVETLNTVYQLGEANTEYKRWDWKRKAAAAVA
jgi:hypothetical protein